MGDIMCNGDPCQKGAENVPQAPLCRQDNPLSPFFPGGHPYIQAICSAQYECGG